MNTCRYCRLTLPSTAFYYWKASAEVPWLPTNSSVSTYLQMGFLCGACRKHLDTTHRLTFVAWKGVNGVKNRRFSARDLSRTLQELELYGLERFRMQMWAWRVLEEYEERHRKKRRKIVC